MVQGLCASTGARDAASLPGRVAQLQKQCAALPRLERFVSDVCEASAHVLYLPCTAPPRHARPYMAEFCYAGCIYYEVAVMGSRGLGCAGGVPAWRRLPARRHAREPGSGAGHPGGLGRAAAGHGAGLCCWSSNCRCCCCWGRRAGGGKRFAAVRAHCGALPAAV